ncbi:MAG TPA: hypothetical protein VFW87_16530 [Pirellulales bacterium]|nr:hypothetical protein [Pirellulales bacterium]
MARDASTAVSSVCTIDSLGKPIYEQKPSTANLAAGIILSVLLVGGGLALLGFVAREIIRVDGNLPIDADHGMSWTAAGIMSLVGSVLAAGGVWLFLWAKSMFSFRLVVCADGFYYEKKGKTDVFAWMEIASVEETVLHERLPIVKGPARQLMPTTTSRAYRVRRCDGKEFFFDGNILSRPSLLAGPLATAAQARGIAWTTAEKTH